MKLITPHTTVDKLIRIFSLDSRTLILEISSINGSLSTTLLSKSFQDLELDAKELYCLGRLAYVTESEDYMISYLQSLKELESVSYDFGFLNPDNVFEITANVTHISPQIDGEDEELSIGYDLEVDKDFEVPDNLSDLLSPLTFILGYYNHRPYEDSVSLN